MRVLENPASDHAQVILAVSSLGRLISAGWLDGGKCARRVLDSPAVQNMDRVAVEELTDRLIAEPARA
jgi:hypothetical protein